MPIKNKQQLATIMGTMNFFSWAYNPGATNAQAWNMVCGREIMNAAKMATFMGTKKGVVTAVAII